MSNKLSKLGQTNIIFMLILRGLVFWFSSVAIDNAVVISNSNVISMSSNIDS